MKIRVGRIPYLNSEPFYLTMARDGLELCDLVPTALSQACELGQIDAGPLPVVDFLRMEERFSALGNFCIATLDKARSVLLFSRLPVQELGGATIGITGETSTSKRLLEVLLTYKCQVKPAKYVPLTEPNDAFLVIGDEALRMRNGVLSYPHCYDLGEEWHQWMDLPFVFAMWAINNELLGDTSTYLEDVLSACVDEGLDRIPEISEKRDDLGMSLSEVEGYYRGFHFRAGTPELKSIEHFKQYLGALEGSRVA